ncbi:nuclear transport factor 2 family protein [Polaromonas sp.]|uniref:nuclear transport factor 2 family protein n=1 Tax=Polaromonas sp. TaxID=1869339 RepID=UPI0033513313
MDKSKEDLLQGLLDREAIREAMYAYCRGIDRCDEAALRSAYWEDATDRHGAYSGSANGFIAHAVKARTNGPRMIHQVSNISIVLKGRHAAVESYFQAFQYDNDPQGKLRETFLCGRYADHFEKRGEEWRIAARTVIYDWMKEAPGPEGDEATRFGARSPNGRMKPDDAWYTLLGQAPFSTT